MSYNTEVRKKEALENLQTAVKAALQNNATPGEIAVAVRDALQPLTKVAQKSKL